MIGSGPTVESEIGREAQPAKTERIPATTKAKVFGFIMAK
jgi:hypothetical protein